MHLFQDRRDIVDFVRQVEAKHDFAISYFSNFLHLFISAGQVTREDSMRIFNSLHQNLALSKMDGVDVNELFLYFCAKTVYTNSVIFPEKEQANDE